MAKEPKEPLGPGECDTATACKLLMISNQWLGQLIKDGWIKRIGRGRFNVVDVVQGHIKYMRDEARRTSQTQSVSRVQTARAEQIELETRVKLGELIPVDDLCDFLDGTIGTFRSELAGVAAASTRDMEVRAEIEKNVDAAIDRCRIAFSTAKQAARAHQPLALESEETDA